MNRASSRPPLRHAALAVCLVAAGCGGHTPATVDPRRPANASATLDQLAQHALAAPLDPRTPGFAALTAAGELIFVDAAGQPLIVDPNADRAVGLGQGGLY